MVALIRNRFRLFKKCPSVVHVLITFVLSLFLLILQWKHFSSYGSILKTKTEKTKKRKTKEWIMHSKVLLKKQLNKMAKQKLSQQSECPDLFRFLQQFCKINEIKNAIKIKFKTTSNTFEQPVQMCLFFVADRCKLIQSRTKPAPETISS